MLLGVGFLVVLMPLDVCRFRPFLAREWHDCPLASSSRSQVAIAIVRTAVRLTCGRPCISVCCCPPVALDAVTYFVTRLVDLAAVELTRFGPPELDRGGERD